MLHIMDFYQRKTLLNKPVNELEGERCWRKFFLALFGHLKSYFKILPALFQLAHRR